MNMFDDAPISRHNRSPLPHGEEGRLETINEKIKAALVDGPKTNKQLSAIALDYGRRIRDLRAAGIRVDRERLKGGLNLYTYKIEAEPLWVVSVQVALADGTMSVQYVRVRGSNEGVVRNRAQHMATKVRVLTTTQVTP